MSAKSINTTNDRTKKTVLKKKLVPEVKNKLEHEVKNKLEHEVKNKLEHEVKNKLEPEVKNKLEPEVKNKLEPEPKNKSEPEMNNKPQTEQELKSFKDLAKILEDPTSYAREVDLKKLVNSLDRMSSAYYNTGEQYVDDDTFDQMFEILRERDPDNPFLFKVGVDPSTRDAVELPYTMPSLDKIKPGEKALEKWFEKYKGPYWISDKLDGVSAQLYKNAKGECSLYTRGKSTHGRNITHLLKYLVDKKILALLPPETSCRGEIIMGKKEFDGIRDLYKNPRNTTAGLVNNDHPDERLLKKLRLVMYGIINPRYTYSEQMKLLKKWGLNVVWNTILKQDDFGEEDEEDEEDEELGETVGKKGNKHLIGIELKLENILTQRKTDGEFEVDGLVIADDSKSYLHSDTNPAYSVAFKMNVAQNMKECTVEEVIWEPTMYGYLQPVLRIKPVELGGTTVTYVTAHNAKYIRDNKIGKGSIIRIVRSGDVIPYVVNVVRSNKIADMPDIEYEWGSSEVDIIVVNPNESTQRIINIKRILHFFRVLKVKFLSQGIVTKLYDYGYDQIVRILQASSEREAIRTTGIGTKMMDKIYDQIDRAMTIKHLPELMAGSLFFGHGIGTRKIREIMKKYPNILDHDENDKSGLTDLIVKVSGFSTISADKFVEGFVKFKEFLQEIRSTTNYLPIEIGEIDGVDGVDGVDEVENENNQQIAVDMSKEIVVMTGFRSDVISDFIESNGGKVTGSVSGKTTMVIYEPNDKTSSKLEKARQLEIPMITRDEFEKKYNLV